MSSRRRRDRGRRSGRRVDLRGGGILRRRRKPASRDAGYLRSERRPGPDDGDREEGRTDGRDGDGSPGAGDDGRDGPVVRIHRRGRSSPAPVAGVTTLAALLFLVLALIFLL